MAAEYELGSTGSIETVMVQLAQAPGRRALVIGGRSTRVYDVSGKSFDSDTTVDVGSIDRLLANTPRACREQYQAIGNASFIHEASDGNRFRIRFSRGTEGASVSLVHLPGELPSVSELGVPDALVEAASRSEGLVLVSGPRGAGRTTTIAAVVEAMCSESGRHIVCIGRDQELFKPDGRHLLQYRTVGEHVPSYSTAIECALSECADVVVVDGLPDTEAVCAALDAAQSGLLVIADVRASRSTDAVLKLLTIAAPSDRPAVKAGLSRALSLVTSQVLLPRADGKGRIAAFEVINATSAVREEIRRVDWSEVAFAMDTAIAASKSAYRQSDRASERIRMLDDSLVDLVTAGTVDYETAVAHAASTDFEERCGASGVGPEAVQAPAPFPEASTPETGSSPDHLSATRKLSRSEMLMAEGHRVAGRRESTRSVSFQDATPVKPVEEKVDTRVVSGRSALVVDDEVHLRDMISKIMQHSGAQVTAVPDARAALDALKSKHFDVALFDIMMPELSGAELYDQVIDACPDLKDRVVFVSGCNMNGPLKTRIADRSGRFVHKPFDAEYLLEAAAAAITGAPHPAREED